MCGSMHSGEREPLSPVDFLFSWWSHDDTLAEYQQQDAHDFYLSALSGLSSAVIAPMQQPTVMERPALSNGMGAHQGGGGAGSSLVGVSGLGKDSKACSPAPSQSGVQAVGGGGGGRQDPG